MATRLPDEEYARHAARHALHPNGKPSRVDCLEKLQKQGVKDEKTLANHTLKVLQAADTKCFRGMYGRECYANDRMNTIVLLPENKPSESTVYHNDLLKKTGEKASARLERMAAKERSDYKKYGVDCNIRTGGSKALERDRAGTLSAQHPLQQEATTKQDSEPEPVEAIGKDHIPEEIDDFLAPRMEPGEGAQQDAAAHEIARPWSPDDDAADIAIERAAREAREAAEAHELGQGRELGSADYSS